MMLPLHDILEVEKTPYLGSDDFKQSSAPFWTIQVLDRHGDQHQSSSKSNYKSVDKADYKARELLSLMLSEG